VEEATEKMARFFTRYPRLVPFREEFWAFCRSNNNAFVNMFGRPRRVPGLAYPRKKPTSYTGSEREAIGALIQGTAAQLTKVALVRIHKRLKQEGLSSLLVQTIHDEIGADSPEGEAPHVLRLMKESMEDFSDKFPSVPIKAEASIFTTNWSEKKKAPKEWNL
jgi:DNA polymerase-1